MTESLWRATFELPRFPAQAGPITTDVAIVGGGISGLTAAVLLSRAGKRVVLIEGDRIASGDTGNTTSHLTELPVVRANHRARRRPAVYRPERGIRTRVHGSRVCGQRDDARDGGRHDRERSDSRQTEPRYAALYDATRIRSFAETATTTR